MFHLRPLRVLVMPESISGTLGVSHGWADCPSQGSSDTHIPIQRQFITATIHPLENLEETYIDIERTCTTQDQSRNPGAVMHTTNTSDIELLLIVMFHYWLQSFSFPFQSIPPPPFFFYCQF